MNTKIEIGQKFGRLSVLGPTNKRRSHQYWACECECGELKEVMDTNLRLGKVKSCGCLLVTNTVKLHMMNRSHGMSDHPLYSIWNNMMRKCYDPTHPQFSQNGGLWYGNEVCEEWHDVTRFVEDVMPRPENGRLSRLSKFQNWGPNNFKWAKHFSDEVESKKSVENEHHKIYVMFERLGRFR